MHKKTGPHKTYLGLWGDWFVLEGDTDDFLLALLERDKANPIPEHKPYRRWYPPVLLNLHQNRFNDRYPTENMQWRKY